MVFLCNGASMLCHMTEARVRKETPIPATRRNLRTSYRGKKAREGKCCVTRLTGGKRGEIEESVLAVSGGEVRVGNLC